MRRARHCFMSATGIALVVLSACAHDRDDEADTVVVAGDIALTPRVVRVSDIIKDPARYLGDTITVVAEVDDVLTTFAFALDESALLAGGLDNLLVFSPKRHQRQDLDDDWHNDSVRVTGMVLQTDITNLERELERDLTPELTLRIGARPVLVAHRVQRVVSR